MRALLLLLLSSHQSEMRALLLLLLFCGASSPATHSLKYFLTASSGVPHFPQVVGAVVVDDVLAGYCNTDTKTLHLKQTWMKLCLEEEPEHLERYIGECLENRPHLFKAHIDSFRQRFNHSEGVHILQWMSGCEWDEETGEVYGFVQYGYDGEDYIALDLKTQTWIASKPQAVVTKLSWDADRWRMKQNDNFYTQICPDWLRMYLEYGKSSLLRTVKPKHGSPPGDRQQYGYNPCLLHVTWQDKLKNQSHMRFFFLPKMASVISILPNHDGTFQMSVELHISPVAPEDWGRYDCVFQLSGVKEDIVIKLDEAVIRTNRVKPSNTTVLLLTALVVLTLVSASVLGFIVYKKKKVIYPPSPPDNASDDGLENAVTLTL
ncbi:putative major histocompatibility complex class I-related protein-like [Scophthalmus maximus]|uniref:Putative major histocompatibility complex class I-related protein-like n=1 Tax=Scophthalmus maximus TaxID=52904 RepID=A0A2U9CX19_SCOMX|nr:putative major histocompatibility complex class I-related protein-like [Scophthalmus maximus]